MRITVLLTLAFSFATIAFHLIEGDPYSVLAPGQSASSFCDSVPQPAASGGARAEKPC